MGLRPLVVSVAAVVALAVPLLASPKISASQSSTGTETSPPSLTTAPGTSRTNNGGLPPCQHADHPYAATACHRPDHDDRA